MPERPDLEYQVPLLHAEISGRRITGVRVANPIVLRMGVPGEPAALLTGRTFTGVRRHGPFVRFALEPADLEVIVHPMLAGRFSFADQGARAPAELAVAISLDDGRELRYRDDKQMGKFWIVQDPKVIPLFEPIGIDVLSPAFTREAFRALAKKRRDQVKPFLLDHAALDSLGNAYSDETLWEARIHPKTRVKELDAAGLDRLHDAIVTVLSRSRDEIATRKPALDEKLRDFLAVRNRKGEACPRCGTTIRVCGIHGHDAFFCPTCQPDAKGRGFVDWRKLPSG
jgi:formamidopyrimidine-DNA glycosylase